MSKPHAPIVVDTSILFSALLNDSSRFVEFIFRSEYEFYICECVIVELFKHNDRLMKYSQLSQDDLLRLPYRLLKRLHIFPERLLNPEKLTKAIALCAPIDVNDTVHVALTLTLDGLLWTGDKTLQQRSRSQNRQRVRSPVLHNSAPFLVQLRDRVPPRSVVEHHTGTAINRA